MGIELLQSTQSGFVWSPSNPESVRPTVDLRTWELVVRNIESGEESRFPFYDGEDGQKDIFIQMNTLDNGEVEVWVGNGTIYEDQAYGVLNFVGPNQDELDSTEADDGGLGYIDIRDILVHQDLNIFSFGSPVLVRSSVPDDPQSPHEIVLIYDQTE